MSLKEGDRIRISSNGRNYRVKWVGNRTVVLETEDRSSQFLTTIGSLRWYFSPRAPKLKRMGSWKGGEYEQGPNQKGGEKNG
jgi:hypothetical protein